MTTHLFPDNTVLCNYACIERIDLLESLLNGNGRWTQAVAFEARKSRKVWPDLGNLFDRNILGEAIEVHDASRVRQIRVARLGGDERKPLEHLGEAETVYLVQNSKQYEGSIWVTDDSDAYEFGKQQGIITWDTVTTLQLIVANGDISRDAAFDLLNKMQDLGRNFRRVPSSKHDL